MEQVNVTGEVQPQKEEYTKKDKILIFIAAFIGFMFCELIVFEGLGISVPLFITIFYAGAVWYLKKRGEKFTIAGLVLFIPIFVLSLCFAFFSNEFLMAFNVLFLFLLMVIQLIYLTGNNLYEKFNPGIMVDYIHGLLIMPFANLGKVFGVVDSMGKNSKSKRTVLQVLLGLIIAVPVLAVVIVLLVSSDFVFERLINSIISFLNQKIFEYFGKIILGMIFAFPIFSYLFSLGHKHKFITPSKEKPNMEFISNATVVTVLGLINVVYITYIAIQFGYLFNAFQSILPAGFNNSSYARRGFFELCAVCFINLSIFFFSYLFSKKHEGKLPVSQKSMFTALSICTFVMIASAFSKMAFYIKEYGLTPNRIYPSWFMLLLTIIFSGVLVKVYNNKFKLFKMSLIVAIIMYVILNIANVDTIIAGVNYQRYIQGVDKELDYSIYKKLSYDAVPYEIKLIEDKNPEMVAGAVVMLNNQSSRVKNSNQSWQVWNYSRYNAEKLLNDNKKRIEQRKQWTRENGITDDKYRQLEAEIMSIYRD